MITVASIERLHHSVKVIHEDCKAMTKGVPLCKIITDFLCKYNVPSVAQIPRELRPLLMARMREVYEILENESQAMLAVYGIKNEGEFAPNQRKVYDARMHAVVLDQDHYP